MTTRPEATTRPAATMPKAQNTPSGTPTKITQGSPTKRAASASPRSAPTAPSRSPASSRTPPTCGTRTCCGGQTLRSTVAHAEIVSIDTSEALATSGVYAVMTYDDLPAEMKNYGLEIQDTPVLANGKVRHHGEPVAIVAADHPGDGPPAPPPRSRSSTASCRSSPTRRPRPPPTPCFVHEGRDDHHIGHVPHPNIVHRQPIIRGDAADEAAKRADVIVTGEYVFGMQGPGLPRPRVRARRALEDGVHAELYVATQWLHSDLGQIAPRPRPA